MSDLEWWIASAKLAISILGALGLVHLWYLRKNKKNE